MESKPTSNSRKRKNVDDAPGSEGISAAPTAGNVVANGAKPKTGWKDGKEVPVKAAVAVRLKDRCKRSQNTEDYINFVGDVMYPKKLYGPYGFHADKLRFPIERLTTLGYLLSPLRRPTVMEKWSPFDIAVFEAAITLYGKNFSRIQKHVPSKTVQDIIEFYYDWKKTSHYKQWKKSYMPDERDVPTVIGD